MVKPEPVASWIVRENALDVVSVGNAATPGGALSVTVMLKLKVPLVVGVPLRVPVAAPRLSPGGVVSIDQL
jgi:hypothetical protein